MPTHNLTPQVIAAAIEGFEAQKTRIDQQIAELRAMVSGAPESAAEVEETAPQQRRKFSAGAIKRMREAQRQRWAKTRGESEPSTPVKPKTAKAKGRLSAAGKAAIVAALKKRWADKKAAETA